MGDGRLDDLFDQFRKELEGLGLASLDDANEFAGAFMGRHNLKGIDDFCGLSPEAMHRMLHQPFDSPNYLEFPTRLAIQTVDCPMMRMFLLLAAKIGDKGVKATVTGNLPRNICREVAIETMTEEEHREFVRYGEIQKEPDFMDFHIVRLTGELAGLIRKVKGRFILSVKCKSLLTKGPQDIYPLLVKTFVSKLNWRYRYNSSEVSFLQQAAPFTLFLLSQFGDEWRPPAFYEDAFIRAFPAAMQLVETRSWGSSDNQLRFAYRYVTFRFFGRLFGLIETQEEKVNHDMEIKLMKKTPLLDETIKFHVG